MKPHFSYVNSAGDRARCPEPECDGKKKYNVFIGKYQSNCHRCKKVWKHNGNNKTEDIVPETINTRTPLFIRDGETRKKAKFDEARKNFIDYFDIVVRNQQLPWKETAKDDVYGIGALNKGQDEVQLVFEINENHYKHHKGQQFGSAECKIFPQGVLPQLQSNSTLLVVEGEKDAITANSNGAPAISFTSGAGALPQNIDVLEKFTNIVIAYDNDIQGDEGAQKIAKAFYKQNKDRKIKILKWHNKPDKYDITDYYVDGHTTNDLLALIDKSPLYGNDPADFGGLKVYDPATYVEKLQGEVVQICDEILLENGTSSISGQSNVGKSILALQFAMCVAMGVPFLTFNVPRPRRVLFVQFEMMDQHNAKRVDLIRNAMIAQYPAKAHLIEKNLRVSAMASVKIFTDQYKAIEGTLMHSSYDVVVIDNLYSSSGTSLHKNDQLTQLMSKIDTLRKEYMCAFMLVSHHKKLEEKRPLEHSMVYGGSYFVNFLDNLIQVANTGRNNQLKVFKITKIRTENEFHEVPLGIWMETEEENQLSFSYKRPLPKNESFWYTDPEENLEERVLKAIKSDGDNFSREQFQEALAETLSITSVASAYKWINKLISLGYITKIERGHYMRCRNELDDLVK